MKILNFINVFLVLKVVDVLEENIYFKIKVSHCLAIM